MKILGIETSCDETSVAVVENGRRVLSNVIFSQINLHAKTGGVVPEVAAREHVVKIIPVLENALKKAAVNLAEIDAIAVAYGPGLLSSLLIGAVTANIASLILRKPIIPVNHIEGHIYSNWLERDDGKTPIDEPKFPILGLTVSGGHNELFLMRNHFDFKIIGETRDDAAGEAFDKVARLLGLSYPGGPSVMKAAKKGHADAYKFPRAMLEKDSFDFSFSGIKTAVLYFIEKEKRAGRKINAKFINDVAASFQEAVVDVLTAKVIAAVEKYNPREVHLAGGVSANIVLRERVAIEIEKLNKRCGANIILRWPQKFEYCTDNAAMIAAAGYYKYKKSPKKFGVNYIEAKAEF